MAKLLKFIVQLGIIGLIVCILGLSVPQFFGIKTTVIDDSYTETNMLMGSVTYSREIEPSLLRLGDDIVVEDGSTVKRYQVIQVNLAEETCQVKDPTLSGDYSQDISLKNGVWETLFAVEYVGYLLIATQSKEGMIILMIGVLVLIILYILAELWRKGPAEPEYEYENVRVKSRKEQNREDKKREERRRQLEEEDLEKKAPRKRKKKSDVIRTGGFIDEISAEDQEIEKKLRMIEKQHASGTITVGVKDNRKDLRREKKELPAGVDEFEEDLRKEMSVAASEAHEELKKEVTAAGIELSEEKLAGYADEDKTLEFGDDFIKTTKRYAHVVEPIPAKEELDDLSVTSMLAQEEPPVPVQSAEDIAKEVKMSGEEPDILKDEVSKVVFFDYSDILADQDNGKKK